MMACSFSDMQGWVQREFPNGKWENPGKTNWLISSPLREDKHPSFSIDIEKRVCLDRATGDSILLSALCKNVGIEEPSREEGKAFPSRGEEEKRAEKEKTLAYVQKRWNEAVPAPADFPYLARKKVAAHDCRVGNDKRMGSVLLVPAYDAEGVLVGIERIPSEPGDKKHLGDKKGTFSPVGDFSKGNPVLVAEGYATGESLHQLTGWPVTVSFTCWNQKTVADILKEKYSMEPSICVDAGEAGQKAAEECRAAGYRVVELPEGSPVGYDWNDVACERGIEAAKALFRERWKLAQAEPKQPVKKSLLSFRRNLEPLRGQKPEMIGGIFPRGGVSILAGQQGSGKSILMQRFCSDVSMGGEILDGVTGHAPKGKTLFLVGELPLDTMNDRQRTASWEHDDKNFVLYSRLDFAKAEIPFDMTDSEGWSNILEIVEGEKPDLIVFDSFMSFNAADESDMKSMQSAFTKLLKLADEMKAAVVLVHHIRKRKTVERQARLHMDDIIGSSIITRNASVAIGAETLEIDGQSWVFVNTLKTWYAPMDEFAFKMDRDEYKVFRGIEINLEPKSPGASRMEAIENAVFTDHKDGSRFTAKEIQEKTDASASLVRRMLKQWTEEEKLRKEGGSRNISYSIMQKWQNDNQTVGITEKDSATAVAESIRITYGEKDSATGCSRKYSGDTKGSDGILLQSHDIAERENNSATAPDGNLTDIFPGGVVVDNPSLAGSSPEGRAPKFPAPSGASDGYVDFRDVSLEEAEAWGASVDGLMSELRERAEREYDPIMSKSPRDCYEKLVRLEYAQAHSTNTPGGDLTDVSPSRGPSLKEIAERAGVPLEAVREELERWQAAGRISLDEEGSISLLAGTAFPEEGKPDEPDEEPEGVPSMDWLGEQSEEVKVYYSGQLERLTIIGVEDPQARALELAWTYAQSMNEGG